MAFNQNQDTLLTLKLTIFLIIIEVMFFFASSVLTIAETGDASYDIYGNPYLSVSDFRYVDSHFYVVNQNGLLIPHYSNGYYTDDKGHIVEVAKGNTTGLQNAIDNWNNENSISAFDAFDFLGVLILIVSFAFIPFPFNIIPILTTTLIGFIILYFVYSEVKAWFDVIYPF